MAFFSGEIRSTALAMDTSVTVALPYDRPVENQQRPCKVLYLLHGLGNNASSWARNTGIERLVRQYGIAVIMPDGAKSFYKDMAYGPKYYTYITEELPRQMNEIFNISKKPEDTYIAGLSMGGYGAMKCALTNPERYAGAASFSGFVDFKSIINYPQDDDQKAEIVGLIGSDFAVAPEDDLFVLAERLEKREDFQIYISCGYDDYLYKDNLKFKKHLENLGIAHKFEDWPGEHNWEFWDKSIKNALNHFFSEN